MCIPGTEVVVNTVEVDGQTVTTSQCDLVLSQRQSRNARYARPVLSARNRDLCGAPCTTYCNGGTGGPNPFGMSTHLRSVQDIMPYHRLYAHLLYHLLLRLLCTCSGHSKQWWFQYRASYDTIHDFGELPSLDCQQWGRRPILLWWPEQLWVVEPDNVFNNSDLTDIDPDAGVINYLAFNCQASTPGGSYNGGSCHFYDNPYIGKSLLELKAHQSKLW